MGPRLHGMARREQQIELNRAAPPRTIRQPKNPDRRHLSSK
jgi:hypothetical protein